MRLKKVLTLALIAACGMGLASCTAESKKTEQVMTQEKATYQKKYTNADFYKDGKFDQEAAKKAFLDMFEYTDWKWSQSGADIFCDSTDCTVRVHRGVWQIFLRFRLCLRKSGGCGTCPVCMDL